MESTASQCCRGLFALLVLVSLAAAQSGSNAYERRVLAIQDQVQKGNLDYARALAAEANRQYPANGGIENLQGVIAIQQGHVEEAEKEFWAAIQHRPQLMSAYLNLGRLYALNAAQDPDAIAKALRVFDKALAVEPGNAEANYDSATLLMRSKKYDQSLERLRKLGPEEKQNLSALAVACVDEAGLGHTTKAEQKVAMLAAREDLTEADIMDTIPAFLAAHRADAADILLSAVASHQVLSATGLRMLGLVHEAEGQLPAAQETLERAFAADSSATTTLVDLARVAEARQDFTGALGYLAHARDIDPSDASLPYLFGTICLKMKLLVEARKALTEALRLAPENPDYNYALGTVMTFAQGPKDALPYFTKYHSLHPADAKGILALGTTSFRAKDWETALPWLKQAANNPSTAASAHYYLGRIARQEGRLDEAVSELTMSSTMGPDQPDVLAELGQVNVQLKKYAVAEKQLDRAAALDADDYAANFGLLQLYAQTGDPRRDDQSKRFEEIKQKSEEELKNTLQSLEIRPGETP